MLFISLVLLGLASDLTAAVPTGKVTNGRAIYVLTNTVDNSVSAVRIGKDGMLSGGARTLTGGVGANGLTGPQKVPAQPDSLFTQGALTIAHNVSHTQHRRLT